MDETKIKNDTKVPSATGTVHSPNSTKELFTKILRILLPLCISGGLILWLFHKIDLHEMMTIIRGECDYRWLFLMMFITMMSHIIRGARWGIQLRAVGIPRMPLVAESVSIFGAYALNLLIPNIGELWRISYVSRREHARFSSVLGTDIGDRLSDLAIIIVLIITTLFVARPAIDQFMTHYAVGREIERIVYNPRLWIGIAASISVVWGVLCFCRNNKYVAKAHTSLLRVWNGFRVLFTMQGRGAYLLLTFGIWGCYFMETYVTFMAFPFTRELIHTNGYAAGFIPGLVVFVFGSCSMGIPSNGGLGPWNLAIIFALSLFGISNTDATAFAMTMWTFQAAMLVALGIFSAIYISLTRRHTPGKMNATTT